jgi:hypothetical protein
MNSEKESLQQLQEIRSLMERSTKFISLSGLSGIIAGCIALAGAALQYWYVGREIRHFDYDRNYTRSYDNLLLFTLANFAGILILAILSAYYFTQKKAKRNNQSLWDSTSQRLLTNLAIPLFSGALFCIVLYNYKFIGLIAPCTLIFYGLALVNGSNFTLRDIRYLGICEIVLGFIACFNIGYGLFFWALGFGILHIAYGIVMYYKYDRVKE